jgi:uncharacterized protein (TIGR02996 family)
MTHDDAFLQAIIEDPEDDTPRLVYADWLEEHRQAERAEFIHIQCELARLPSDDPRRPQLKTRERELLDEYKREWVGPLGRWACAHEFRRGFVEAITVRPEAFLEHAEALFQTAPIQSVTFQDVRFQLGSPNPVRQSAAPFLPRLAACPQLTRLSAIDFRWNGIGDSGVEALAASPNVSRLTSLLLSSNRIGPAGARALALSPYLTRLVSLDLDDNPLGDEGAQALAASPNLGGLLTLGLAASGLGTAGARALVSSPYLARLKSLNVRGNFIGNKAREALRLRFGKGKCRF